MRFEGKIEKKGSLWLIQATALDLMTQGHSRRQAWSMFKDAVETLVDVKGFQVEVFENSGHSFEFSANKPDVLIALLLKRQRQKYGLTLKEVARRLGSSSVNAYARYEQGKVRPTVQKLVQLLEAVNPELGPVLRLAA